MSITQKLIKEENLLKTERIKDYTFTGKGIIAYIAAIECLAKGNNLSTNLVNETAGLDITNETLRLFKNEIIYENKITIPSGEEIGEEIFTFHKSIPEEKLESMLKATIQEYKQDNTIVLTYALIGEGMIHTELD